MVDVIDLTGDTPPRRRHQQIKPYSIDGVSKYNLQISKSPTSKQSLKRGQIPDHAVLADSPKKKRKSEKLETCGKSSSQEKRLRRFRTAETTEYRKVKDRALTQKMFLIDRTRLGTEQDPSEKLLVAGSTGNLYTVIIGHELSCDCPHALKGHQCKHMVFVMIRVLKAPHHLQYQLALLTSELQLIFQNAPPIITEEALDASVDEIQQNGKRKPVECDCPICFMEFGPSDVSESVVYCKAACGNNFHAECFRVWKSTKQAARAKVTCPLCRTEWDHGSGSSTDNIKAIKGLSSSRTTNGEGYVNVAEELGLSGVRDSTTYHAFHAHRWGGRRGYRSNYYDYD